MEQVYRIDYPCSSRRIFW